MTYQAHHLAPHSDDALWPAWEGAIKAPSGQTARRLPPGQTKTLIREASLPQAHLAIITLAAPTRHALHLRVDGRSHTLTHSDDYPLFRFARIERVERGPLEVGNTTKGAEEVLVHAFHLLPLPGMTSGPWLPATRRFLRRVTGPSSRWSPYDFPCSHFDGVKYLQWNADVRQAMLDRKCPSAFHHYLKFGRREGRAFPFAVDRQPNPGSLLNLAHMLRAQEEDHKSARLAIEAKQTEAGAQIRSLGEENELLLLQLHQVQEELEQYFLDNRKLQKSQEGHTAVVAERDDLATRHASLATALEELQAKHSSLVAERDSLQARVKEIEDAAAATTKERDQAKAERDAAAKERDALKKTVSDRAMRIAELEAQVADQAERQKQIDEEMAKAEGQLEMLKELLRPALT